MILHVFIWDFCIFLQKYLSHDRADIQSGKHYYSKIININFILNHLYTLLDILDLKHGHEKLYNIHL